MLSMRARKTGVFGAYAETAQFRVPCDREPWVDASHNRLNACSRPTNGRDLFGRNFFAPRLFWVNSADARSDSFGGSFVVPPSRCPTHDAALPQAAGLEVVDEPPNLGPEHQPSTVDPEEGEHGGSSPPYR
jgi:hypothetical protein